MVRRSEIIKEWIGLTNNRRRVLKKKLEKRKILGAERTTGLNSGPGATKPGSPKVEDRRSERR